MKHILFVDDESRVLDGLRRLLHPFRHEWEMTFLTSGEAALGFLASAPCDVVVTDMRMPGMNGAELLAAVRDRHPGIVRIVLSGHPDLELALLAVPVAHQFLTKPCEPGHLRELIERALRLHELLESQDLRRLVGELRTLPSRPAVYTELTTALADADVSLHVIATIIERDLGLSIKVLQLINSGFFTLPSRVTSVERAVQCVGTAMLKNLTLSAEVFRVLPSNAIPGFSLDGVHRHAQLTARIATLISIDSRVEDVFLAAILHDVGKIVLACHLPDHLGRMLAQAKCDGRTLHSVEHEHGQAGHAEIGAYLLGLWGLPYPIVEAVAYHHEPRRVPQQRFDVLGIVHVADVLAHELERGDGSAASGLDLAYLEEMGVAPMLPEWRARIAAENPR